MRPTPFALLSVVVAATACSASKPSEFPTRAEIAAVADSPAPVRLFAEPEGFAEPWQLVDALPAALDAREHVGATPWDQLVWQFTSQRAGLAFASEAYHCVAEHTARYVAYRGRFPPRALKRFIAARCGAPSASFASRSVTLPASRDQPDQAVIGRLYEDAPKMLSDLAGTGAHDVGLAMVRGETQAVVVAVAERRQVVVRSMPFVPGPDGKIVLRGELLEPVTRIQGYVNRGPFGYARCAQSPAVRLPAFELTCEPALEDASAAISVVALPPGRVLGPEVIDTLIFPAGAPAAAFTPRQPAASSAAGGALTPPAIVAALNARRAEAGLAPVVLDAPQSALVTKLAPHFFAATYGREDELVADVVTLGVMAGWDVQGMVRAGHSTALVTPAAATPDDLVSELLESPPDREALFGPGVHRVAVGLVRDASANAAGALFGAYELLDTTRHADEGQRLFARIQAARAARSLSPPAIVPVLAPEVARAARAYEVPGNDAEDVLEALSAASVSVVRVGVRTFCLSASSVEDFEFPEDLIARPNLTLALAVGHRKGAESPWASLVAFIVVVEVGNAPVYNAKGPRRARPL